MKAYENLAAVDLARPFSPWLYRIAHNEAISWHRRLKARPEGYLAADADMITTLLSDNDTDMPDERFDREVDSKILLRELEQLNDKYLEVLILRYLEHLEYEEISDVLKIPVGTVGTLVHRAKKQLKDRLKDLATTL